MSTRNISQETRGSMPTMRERTLCHDHAPRRRPFAPVWRIALVALGLLVIMSGCVSERLRQMQQALTQDDREAMLRIMREEIAYPVPQTPGHLGTVHTIALWA